MLKYYTHEHFGDKFPIWDPQLALFFPHILHSLVYLVVGSFHFRKFYKYSNIFLDEEQDIPKR